MDPYRRAYRKLGNQGLFDSEEKTSMLNTLGNPLERLSETIDFEMFRETLEVGLYRERLTNAGAKPYDYVLMFKILVLQRMYNLSDEQTEYQIADRTSFRNFLGLASGFKNHAKADAKSKLIKKAVTTSAEQDDSVPTRLLIDNDELVWEKIIENFYKTGYVGIHSEESNYDLHVDSDGYIYAISTGVAAQGQSLKGTLTKLSPKGEIMYRRYYHPLGRNATGSMYLGSISPTPDGGFVMGGYTDYNEEIDEMFNGYYQQPWIVKTDHEGLDGLCYTELPELDFDVFIPDTVCNLDTIDCVVNISGPSAPYTLEFSTGQVIDSIYYPDVFVPKEIGIDTEIVGNDNMLYQYSEVITEATQKDTIRENIIAKHYNIRTPRDHGEQQLAITLTDFYGNTKTIYKDIYVNPCHEVEVDENENVVLSVYPNPATEYINIAGENIAEIEICNLLGEVVYYICNVAPRHDTTNVISTENMPAGSYFVRVRMEDGKVVTKKIVVVKG